MAPDLPRKESVTSATNLDIGLANALRIIRAKAGMGMKDQRMSSPGSLLRLHLERLKSRKPMERLSTGVQAASAGLLPTPWQRTLVMAREVLMEQMVVVLQSTTLHSLLTHLYGPPKTRLFQVRLMRSKFCALW